MRVDWKPLRDALARYRASGRSLGLWWRDDDAIDHTPALDRLERLAHRLSLPVHLAVIPKPATRALAQTVADSEVLVPLVHGWAHANHAPEGMKKSEFGQPRDGAAEDLRLALARMRMLFDGDVLPVFVPPWNRMDDSYLETLVRLGFRGVSAFTPRQKREPVPGLVQINTHVDLIDWRGTKGLVDPQHLIEQTAGLLDARAQDRADAEEPLGFLTHHLVHTPEIWDFSESFLGALLEGGATVQALRPLLRTDT
jgi:hypothetical protein